MLNLAFPTEQKWFRSILRPGLLVLIFIAALAFGGCGSDKAAEEKTTPDIQSETSGQAGTAAPKTRQLVYASTKDIRNINPHLYCGEMAAQNMVFEPLAVNTMEGLKPCLAKTWDISSDGKVYTFHLRPGVKFTDGATKDGIKGYIGTGPWVLSEHKLNQDGRGSDPEGLA